jgi:hypothetical protein
VILPFFASGLWAARASRKRNSRLRQRFSKVSAAPWGKTEVRVVLDRVLTLFGRPGREILPPASLPLQQAAPVGASPGPALPESRLWPANRLAVAEGLWGEGFLFPGGETEILRLATPMGLSASTSLLVVGTGSGGPPRAIAKHLAGWVSGFEADPALVSRGAALCASGGLGRRVGVEWWDPAAPAFRKRHYHHGLALEPLRDSDPEAFLTAFAGALKPSGQMVLVETVADSGSDTGDAHFLGWMALDGRLRPPLTEAAVTGILLRLGLDVRVTENISDRHVSQTLDGWCGAVTALRNKRPDPRRAAPLVAEAELWLRRLGLIRDGKLRLVRWSGFKSGAG